MEAWLAVNLLRDLIAAASYEAMPSGSTSALRAGLLPGLRGYPDGITSEEPLDIPV